MNPEKEPDQSLGLDLAHYILSKNLPQLGAVAERMRKSRQTTAALLRELEAYEDQSATRRQLYEVLKCATEEAAANMAFVLQIFQHSIPLQDCGPPTQPEDPSG